MYNIINITTKHRVRTHSRFNRYIFLLHVIDFNFGAAVYAREDNIKLNLKINLVNIMYILYIYTGGQIQRIKYSLAFCIRNITLYYIYI